MQVREPDRKEAFFSDKWRKRIRMNGASRPDRGYYIQKFEFKMQVATPNMPPALLGYRPGTEDTRVKKQRDDETPGHVMPRAFNIAALEPPCHGDTHDILPHTIFKTRDERVLLKTFILPAGMESPRIVNADGDEVWFVHKGSGTLTTPLGNLRYRPRCFIRIPKSFTYRFRSGENTLLIGMESADPLRRPELKDAGLNATCPYDDLDLEAPQPLGLALADGADARQGESAKTTEGYSVSVKRAHRWFHVIFEHSPFACFGWRGSPYPFVLPLDALSFPTLQNEHTDPTSFATFATPPRTPGELPDAMIGTFLPHRVHSPPYYHTNYWDECLFLAADYAARGGSAGAGSMSFHPQGVPHGPQPAAWESWREPKTLKENPYVEMCAVMFESRSPLIPNDEVLAPVEVQDYWKSWTK